MKFSFFCAVVAFLIVQKLAQKTRKLRLMEINRPIIETTFTEDELRELELKLQPSIDGPTTGTLPPPENAGRLTRKSKRRNKNLHVISGQRAKHGQFPWQVGLDIDGKSFCGGSIISNVWVLTAAHCTSKANKINLLFGAQNVDVYEKSRILAAAYKKIVHSGWSEKTLQHDICLLKVQKPLTFTEMMVPVRLPSQDQAKEQFLKEPVTISGWGRRSDDVFQMSSELYFVDLMVVTILTCLKAFGKETVFTSSLCVMGEGQKSTCQGDSGGPLVLKEKDGNFTQIGIVSYGAADGCGKGFPDVFTRVSSYLSWISNNTGLQITENRTKPNSITKDKGNKTTSAKPKIKNTASKGNGSHGATKIYGSTKATTARMTKNVGNTKSSPAPPTVKKGGKGKTDQRGENGKGKNDKSNSKKN